VHRSEGFGYAIDNGAWTAHQQDQPFDMDAFTRLLASHGAAADWFILPDIVGGGLESLAFSLSWLAANPCPTMPLLAVQDGMEPRHDPALVGPHCGLAVGGSTDWKLATVHQWAELGRQTSAYVHVLRVNSVRRLNLCSDAGVDSFDGSGPSRFFLHGVRMSRGLRQQHLFGSPT